MPVLHEISSILNTGLDKHTLSLCVSLCENGVNPEALAVHFPRRIRADNSLKEVIRELRREAGLKSSDD
jgi:mitotic-spindle organizing protein 1